MYTRDEDLVEIKEEFRSDTEEERTGTILTKYELEYKIKRSDCQNEFFFTANENCKSYVWERFLLIFYRGIKQDFVRCRKCCVVLSYKSKTGTASLLRHNCDRKNLIKGPEPTESIPHALETTFNNKNLSENRRSKIHKRQLYFIAKDLHSFNTTDCMGFRKLGQSLLDIGADYGKQNIGDILAPSDYLINDLMSTRIQEITVIIRRLIQEENLALSVDLAKDDCDEKMILTIFGHVITESFVLKSFAINTIDFLKNQISTDFREYILMTLNEYIPNATSKLDAATVVMEGYSGNMASVSHIVKSIAKTLLEEIPIELMTTIKTIDDLLKFLGFHTLETKEKDEHIYQVLKYYHERFEDFRSMLQDNKEHSKLSNTDMRVLHTLYEILTIFKECADSMSCNTLPTINNVYLWKIKLENYCNGIRYEATSPSLEYLKTKTLSLLNERFIISDVQKVALFLNPNFKGLKFLNLSEKQQIYDIAKNMIDTIKTEDGSQTLIHRPPNFGQSPPLKKFKDEYYFGDMMDPTDNDDSEQESTDSEIFRYNNLKLKIHCTDILGFWKIHTEFPTIRKLVRRVLNIPASVMTQRQQFCAKRIDNGIGERCVCSSNDNFKSLLFLHQNIDLKD